MQEILRRASEEASAGSDDGIRHEELVAAAREAGLDPTAVEAAAAELAAGETQRQAIERVTRSEIARRRRRFRSGAVSWGVFTAFAAVAYLLLGATAGTLWPFVVPSLVWGFFVTLAGIRALGPPDPEWVERRVERERRDAERARAKQRAKETAEAWARKLQDEIAARTSRSEVRKQKALELEDAIEDGVRAVLGALARAVKDAVEPPRGGAGGGAGDFARYVERQRSGGPPPARPVRVEAGGTGQRVRVEDGASSDGSEDESAADARPTVGKRTRSKEA